MRPFSNPKRSLRRATAVALLLTLAGCETATPYQPLTRSSSSSGGYSDIQIEPNRFRVAFSGNSMTSRETVETYLLYRAAQLSLDRGFDWFKMADRNTERHSNTYISEPFRPGPWGYWGPAWRYHSRFGWRGWDPFWGDPFWDRDIDVREIARPMNRAASADLPPSFWPSSCCSATMRSASI